MIGGQHGQDTIKAGDRCSIQPTGDRDFDKEVLINGTRMTFRQAQLGGFLKWQHSVPLGADRSYAVYTEKAAALNRTVHTSRRPATPPSRAARLMTGPAYGLQRGE